MSTPPSLPSSAHPLRLVLVPLKLVPFPGGELSLTISSSRLAARMQQAHTQQQRLGVVAIQTPAAALPAHSFTGRDGQTLALEPVGVMAWVSELLQTEPVLRVRCTLDERFLMERIDHGPELLPSAPSDDPPLLHAWVKPLAGDQALAPPPHLHPSVRALMRALPRLRLSPADGHDQPWQNAGWVANRWCELLPLPQAAKQALMALHDPLQRLELVQHYLGQQGLLMAKD